MSECDGIMYTMRFVVRFSRRQKKHLLNLDNLLDDEPVPRNDSLGFPVCRKTIRQPIKWKAPKKKRY